MIEVFERENDMLKLKFNEALGYSKIKESELFEALEAELAKIYEFREFLGSCNLDELNI